MVWPCESFIEFARTTDISSACIQANASLNAGSIQAAAAIAAGWLTFWAGIVAFAGALGAGALGVWGINRQIASAQILQREDQKYNVKKEVYLNAVSGFADGMMSLNRIGDLSIKISEALDIYNKSVGKVTQIHVIASEEVLISSLNTSLTLAKIQANLLEKRIKIENNDPITEEEKIDLIKSCSESVVELRPFFKDTVLAMRRDISLPIDEEIYDRVLKNQIIESQKILKKSLNKTKSLLPYRVPSGNKSSFE